MASLVLACNVKAVRRLSSDIALKDWPRWLQKALQGITYWIGHRRCLFGGYPLSEGALVAELCNLIYANLPSNRELACEITYSSILAEDERPSFLRERARVDIAIFAKNRNKDDAPEVIVEVKRASSGRMQIDADLRRLAAVRSVRPHIQTFLIVIAEARRPARFVNEDGQSVLTMRRIPDHFGYYKVRRTWKAAHAFKTRDTAQYACLVEVFPGA
jgi:hypothetical protein